MNEQEIKTKRGVFEWGCQHSLFGWGSCKEQSDIMKDALKKD